MLSDFIIDLVVHRLKLMSVSYSWDKEQWILVDISAPWLVHKFVSDNIFIVMEVLGNLSPEVDKFVPQPILVIPEVSDCRADGLCKVIVWPWVTVTVFSGWVSMFINFVW